jgi:hypothetical protein
MGVKTYPIPPVTGVDLIAGGTYPLPLDRNGAAVPIIEPEHSRIHEGMAYMHSHEHIVDNNEIEDHLFVNPANNFPHLRHWLFHITGAPASVEVYEGTTVSNNGAPAIMINLNRASSNTSNVVLYNDPVVTDVGTSLPGGYIVGGKLSGGRGIDTISEIIMKPSTNYLIRFINRSGVTIDSLTEFFWYES